MTRKATLLALLALVLASNAVYADIVALKKSPGLTVDIGLDATIKAAIAGGTLVVYSGPDMAGDTYLWSDPNYTDSGYRNYGATAIYPYGNYPFLSKFKVLALPNFAGGKILKAQLRIYYTGGNTGFGLTAPVLSSDWTEGVANAAFPGAAGGASLAHPMGKNTSNQQDANGLPASNPAHGPLQSWSGNTYFTTAKDVGATTVGSTKTGYTANLPDGSNPTYDGFAVMDVTQFVQAWADGTTPLYGLCTFDSSWNYSPHFSETTVGADFQPVLVINYQQNAAPNPVTDLAIVSTDWYKVNLRWTAPSDSPPGPVSRYEVRFSNNPINEGNWDAATVCACGVATPGATGTVENLTIKDLLPSTIYYFAIKCFDITNLVSPISNVVSATTLPTDAVAPAAISLAAPNVKPNYAVLTWTAVGDDGVTGVAADYDLRYSTSPINEANWASATRIAGLAAPKVAGSAETFTIHGLTPSTTYYFAIKAGDEVPNWSPMSNLVTFTTLGEDLLAPNAVTDLKVNAAHIRTVYLAWTAPADVGTAGMAGYDIRYSTSPIDAGNWDSASQAPGEPFPATAGAVEHFSISGLQADTTYYVAMKSFDYAEPANVSAISNTTSGKTMQPVLPITIKNPWVTNDRVADTHNIAAMGSTYVKAYTPDGVIAPTSDEDKAINIYNNQKRRSYHWADEPPNGLGTGIDDPTYTQNIFGWNLCGRHASQACTIVQAAGLTPRKIGLPGHWVYEVQYADGTWHLYDTMTTMYIYNRATPRKVASCDQIQVDNNLMLNAVAEGRACPGFLLCGDTPAWFADAVNHYSPSGSGVVPALWTGNMDVRIGESFNRTWESWVNQHPTPRTNADGAAGNDPPYHHEANKDWKDTANAPYWEPYQLTSAQNTALNIPLSPTYRRWSNGTYTLAPDFTSQAYQAMLEPISTNLATYNDDGLAPNLHVATVNTTANAIFKINIPFYLTDASISGAFYKKTASDVTKLYFSTNGTSWTQVWDNTATGTTQLTNLSLRGNVLGQWIYYVKVELKAIGAKNDAGVSNLVINTTFEHNKGAMAYLDKGVNNITVTFDNPADLASGRAAFKVTYKWKEYDGTGWNVDKSFEQYVTASPTTFSINVAGTKVPRTEYIKMEVTEPPTPDSYAPDAVSDLSIIQVDAAKVTLHWTSTGDDGNVGQATSYDLRYSTAPITAGNFDAATAVVGVPAPKVAGSAETFVVKGLTPNTTYYFAMKVRDEGGNLSALSNVVMPTTLPPDVTAPAFVTDLLAKSSKTAGAVDLTWTAVGNNGFTGTAASYDLRYSTNPIDDSNWAAATKVNGLPAPKTAGLVESLQVAGLVGGTRYYFAIKVTDEAPNTSEISNIAEANAPTIGEKTLQVGLDGYVGCTDSYYMGNSANNYYGIERMTVCGYADLGVGNIQRGILKFDLASIPAGATLTGATLSLYSYDPAQVRGSTGFYGVYPVSRAWTDSQVNWTVAKTGTNWTTAGGDFAATADATSSKQGVASVWYPFDVKARVQAWLASPTSNNGWIVKCADENAHNQDRFYQSDTANATFRPKLVISDLAAPVPGDINGDGAVDVVDLLTLASAWGKNYGDRDYDPRCDLNLDNSIDVVDLLTLAENWPH